MDQIYIFILIFVYMIVITNEDEETTSKQRIPIEVIPTCKWLCWWYLSRDRRL